MANLTLEELLKRLGVLKVEFEGNPAPGRFVEDGRGRLAGGSQRRICPDQAVVFVCEAEAVPLANATDGLSQRCADGVDRLERGGVFFHGVGIDADRVDRADALEEVG